MAEIWKLSAERISEKVRSKELSAVEVTQSALDRLADVNPRLIAVVQEFPEEALEEAGKLDARIRAGEDVGLLAGVPVTTKVNVDQKGKATTNGINLQADLIAEHDNPVVENLRKAGAIIIGRTNTPAFSLRWFTRNSLHGATKNPHNADLTPGGSSGGAASATAAGIGAIGHGTDIAGSVRYPAYACGLHGLRPTLGRIPAANLSALDRHIGAQLMAVSGPLARTVKDVELGFHAMAAQSAIDPWWCPVPLSLPQQEKKVALSLTPCGMKTTPEVKQALQNAAVRLQNAGWEVEEVECPDLTEPARLQAVLWLAEFRRGAAALVEKEGDPDAQFVYEQMAKRCPEPDLNSLLDSLQSRVAHMREWQLFLEKHPVLLCPVSGELPFPDQLDVESHESFDRVFDAQLLQIAPPFLGLPGMAVTTGIGEDNTPVGVQLIGARFREDTLLRAAYAIETDGPDLPVVTPA